MEQVKIPLSQTKRYWLIFVLILSTLFALTSQTLAAPTGDITGEVATPDANTCYVDLVADVPSDFDGTVYVLLSHEDGEFYNVSCNALSGFKGTKQVPKGEFWVEEVYTSEDSFVYEAFLNAEDNFVLEENIKTLHVEVKYNPLGAEFVEDPDRFGPAESTPEVTPDEPTPEIEEPQPSVSTEPSSSSSASSEAGDIEEDTPEQAPESENAVSGLIKHIMIVLAGSAVFCGIVFVIVYFVRKRNE